eukprot:TRINITY_DN16824_c0_g1_i2.p1 TRINITY_DN16824_c0_g1~~TRINITY_DN16824_c0_g1_i2.p1  ORF type:complete len:590 (-),score=84.23 TRINITY_DN16824_c0_g1_i2:227-1996(-)
MPTKTLSDEKALTSSGSATLLRRNASPLHRKSAHLLSAIVFAQCATRSFGAGLQWPGCSAPVLEHFPGGWPSSLDWGLYWHSVDGRVDKAIPGKRSQFYNPSNKTVIFFPGWHGEGQGTTPFCYRSSTFCDPDVCHDQRQMMKSWFAKGWNVGFFYWDQFADESCARDAEQKIWIRHADKGLRWASFNWQTGKKTYLDYPATRNMTLVDLCVNDLENTLGDFSGDSLRFVGHSLGAQLAAATAQMLLDVKSKVRPTRLTMLDAVFTERHMRFFRCNEFHLAPGVGDLSADHTAKAVEALWMQGVPTEDIKSSVYTRNELFDDPNVVLNHLTLSLQYYPDWCNAEYAKVLRFYENWECKHKAAVPTYFEGMDGSPPKLSGTGFGGYDIPGACLVPSAACSDEEIKGLMHTQEKARVHKHKDVLWRQVTGQSTITTSDDSYQLWTSSVSAETNAMLPTAPPNLFLGGIIPQPNGDDLTVPHVPSHAPGGISDPGSIGAFKKPEAPSVAPSGTGEMHLKPAGMIESGSLSNRLQSLPKWKQATVLVLAGTGILLLLYAILPCITCRSAREGRWQRFGSSSEDDSGSSADEAE